MDTFIDYISSLDYWRTHVLPAGGLPPPRDGRVAEGIDALFERSHPTSSELPADELERLGFPLEGLSLLVPSQRARVSNASFETRVWGGRLPAAAFHRVSEHVYICTPEFVLLRMASVAGTSDMDASGALACVVSLAFELCGGYALSATDDRGFIDRLPVMTAASLGDLLLDAGSANGILLARRARDLVLEGTASPMEAVMAATLTLPRRLGGYGLSGPIANHRVDVPDHARGMSGQAFYLLDLCYPDAKCDVEYDSEGFHANAAGMERDAKRRNTLSYLGYETITVTNGQLRSVSRMDQVARQVAKAIGKKWKKVAYDDVSLRVELRRNLLAYRGCLPPVGERHP